MRVRRQTRGWDARAAPFNQRGTVPRLTKRVTAHTYSVLYRSRSDDTYSARRRICASFNLSLKLVISFNLPNSATSDGSEITRANHAGVPLPARLGPTFASSSSLSFA